VGIGCGYGNGEGFLHYRHSRPDFGHIHGNGGEILRTVAGTLKDPNGTAIETDIILTATSYSGSGGSLFVPIQETVTSNSSGVYSVDLATGISYRCQIKNAVFNFDLEDGSSTSLDALL
jgi:lysine/ornithine N-monooxygenase